MANKWTDEQDILALEFYYTCPEATQTDAHATCARVAAEISKVGPTRTAGALDAHLRNVKAVDVGNVGLDHVSDAVKKAVVKYKANQALLAADAAKVRAKYKLGPLFC